MELVLKKNWDLPISVPVSNELEEGVFVGREMEVQLLKNEVLRKDQGAILVSGHRGVGKTSLIYKALHEVNKELRKNETTNQQNKKTLLVLINAGQFQSVPDDSTELPIAEKILKTIIRRLYATAKTNYTGNFNNELDLLYKKAISKEYKLQETLLKQMENISATTQTNDFNFSFKNIDQKHLIEFLLFLAGSILIILKPLQAGLNVLLGLLTIFPLPFILNYAITKSRSKNNKNTYNESAELLYQLDNNISNLEHDLEEIHKKMNHEGWKIVYIIDELDKLDNIKNVLKVIKYFKNLFTLSKAIFIFIGNEDIYMTSSIEHDGKNYRPEQYTYFTSKYFISRPTWDELTVFLINCMKESEDVEKLTNEVKMLHHYLAYEAENDFFSLISVMKNHICKYDKNGFPILVINMESSDNIKKSRIHKCQEVVFNKKYYVNIPARRYENEQLLRQLIKYAQQIINSPRRTQFIDPADNDNTSSIKRDFNNSLLKLEVFSWAGEEKQMINDVEIPIRKYHYTSYFKSEPPDRFNILSEKENTLVGLSMNYLENLLPIINYFLKSEGIEYSPEQVKKEIENGRDLRTLLKIEWLFISESWQTTFQNLIQDSVSTSFSRDEIESQIELLTEKMDQISNSSFNLLKDIIITDTMDQFNLSTDSNFWNTRKSKYYTEELKAEKDNILILQKEGDEIEHIIVKSPSPLINQLLEIPENSCILYIIQLPNDESGLDLSKIKNHNYYQIKDLDSLIKELQVLKADMYRSQAMDAASLEDLWINFKKPLFPVRNSVAERPFSKREIELLKLVCTELTIKEIAEKMALSPRTTISYLDSLYERTGVRSRVGLALFAINHKIYNLYEEQ